MKVLLTGGTGFLGSHVARQLIAAGHRVRGLVRQPRYEGVLKQLDVELAVGDVLDPDSLARAAAGVDAVVHAAGNVGARLRDREQLYRVNVEGTQNVLAAARRAGVRRFVHTSSVVAVGTRTTPERMDEDTAFNAGGTGYHYVDSKRQGEELALQAAQDGFEVVVLNPGTMMGPGDVHLTSTRFVLEYVRGRFRRYPGGGMPYCDIRDVAEAHVAALTRGEPGRRYILAGHDRSFRELLEALHALTGLGEPKPLPL
ncbi:MAG: NAD-dependent epimerase/dehydratase family protein, partial [Myxococcales bacterium]